MKNFDFKNVQSDTWVRTFALAIAFISQLLVTIGKTTKALEIDDITVWLSYIATFIASALAWWKNNSFTKGAQQADILMNEVNKNGK